jgi:UDP-glucose 4-epimerase
MVAVSCDRLQQSDTFNVGTGKATSLNELLGVFQSLIGDECRVERLPARISDIRSVSLSPQRILELLPGFQFTSLEQGLRETLADHGLIK